MHRFSYTVTMSDPFNASHLDVIAFAKSSATLSGQDLLSKYERITEDSSGLVTNQVVDWQALGEYRKDSVGHGQPWIHLLVNARRPMICQRCLEPADICIAVNRSFRFVADEDQAQAQDDEAEEDLLVISHDFDLKSLIEDELLLESPVVAKHETCPGKLKMAVLDPDFESSPGVEVNPFAVLGQLKNPKLG